MNNFKYMFKHHKNETEIKEEQHPMAFSRSVGSDEYIKEYDLSFLYENYDRISPMDLTIPINNCNYTLSFKDNTIALYGKDFSIIISLKIKTVTIEDSTVNMFYINEYNYLKFPADMEKYQEIFDYIINVLKSKI